MPPDGGDDGEDTAPAGTDLRRRRDSGGRKRRTTGSDADTGEPDDLPPGPWDDRLAESPPFEQIPGDPDAGYWAMLHEGYVSCGIPYALFDFAQPVLGERAPGRDPARGATVSTPTLP